MAALTAVMARAESNPAPKNPRPMTAEYCWPLPALAVHIGAEPAQPSPALDLHAHFPRGDQASSEQVTRGVTEELLAQGIQFEPFKDDRGAHQHLAQGGCGIGGPEPQGKLANGCVEFPAKGPAWPSGTNARKRRPDVRHDIGADRGPTFPQIEN